MRGVFFWAGSWSIVEAFKEIPTDVTTRMPRMPRDVFSLFGSSYSSQNSFDCKKLMIDTEHFRNR